jgi:hypothetical protein
VVAVKSGWRERHKGHCADRGAGMSAAEEGGGLEAWGAQGGRGSERRRGGWRPGRVVGCMSAVGGQYRSAVGVQCTSTIVGVKCTCTVYEYSRSKVNEYSRHTVCEYGVQVQ